ncbi:MAG: hypothetical protein M1816_002939 [Peltula sp. TS41687]|nr:MAG: hypothetical protein M1816_002939 [Peltula sp. TS41687]
MNSLSNQAFLPSSKVSHIVPNLRNFGHVRLFELDETNYVAFLVMKCPLPSTWPSTSLVTTVPVGQHEKMSKESLRSKLTFGLQHDDVFRHEFLTRVLFVGRSEREDCVEPEVGHMVDSWGECLYLDSRACADSTICAGPHLIAEGALWRVFRLYDDMQGAFMVALTPQLDSSQNAGNFSNLRITSEDYQVLSVAVPSRMAFFSAARPLDGVRIAVKDLYNLKGLTSSLCNRAYYRTNSPATSTASCIQRLLTAGAQVLGSTKLSSLISREEPTEAVDYQAPFNPRGDGYQSPAGSSSGSAVAVTSYDWVDFAVGTDTSGSGRRPAMVNGCFQFRPSHDLIELEGMIPTFLPFDTPCLLGRDVKKFKNFVSAWYNPPVFAQRESGLTRPVTVVYPLDYFPVANPEQQSQTDSFIRDLETFLDVKASRLSISETWDRTTPSEAKGQSVQDYLQDVIVQTYYHDFYHSTDEFRAQCWSKYRKEPYVNSFVKWRWGLGKQVTKVQHEEGMHRLTVYKTWFLSNIMATESKDTLVVLPIAEVGPNYRDTPPANPSVQRGFESLFLSPILGSPDIVIPIAQMVYQSKISGQEEVLPICVNLVGSPGFDLRLIDTVQACLESAGRATSVQTGSTIFA